MLTRKSILIVDDEPANRALLNDILVAEGCRTITAESGARALDFVRSIRPDLILLDIMMPVVNGFDVLQQLKSDAVTAEIPMIVITVLDDPESIARALGAGAGAVLTKPFTRVQLLACVERMLRDRRSADAGIE
jgi:Response regulator containing a CheY-like receiver domain and an HD-GYP domain